MEVRSYVSRPSGRVSPFPLIAIGEGEGRLFVSLDIGYATEDGSSATVYVGAVTADSIPILLKNEGFVTVLFRKAEG